MMGIHDTQPELFSYHVNLDKRVRADNPLRAIREQVDFTWVRDEVAHCYGYNGNESTDPAVILKLLFLLFLDNVESERELMRIVAERLDYLWFLGYGLDDEIPDHSVLSKARTRWGRATFERFFVRSVSQCVALGLVDGKKIHLDSSLVDADAARGSMVTTSPEMVAALRAALGRPAAARLRTFAYSGGPLIRCIGFPSHLRAGHVGSPPPGIEPGVRLTGTRRRRTVR